MSRSVWTLAGPAVLLRATLEALSVVATLALVLSAQGETAVVRTNTRCEFRLDLQPGRVEARLRDRATGLVWAEGPYASWLLLESGSELRGLSEPGIKAIRDGAVITGRLQGSGLVVTVRFVIPKRAGWVEEQITLQNVGTNPVAIADLGFGLQRLLDESVEKRRWVAVPFRRQADGKLHDYSAADLRAGRFSNSDWRNDDCVADQSLSDLGKLRSEAWAWTDGQRGLLIAKYNQQMIEYSMAAVERAARTKVEPWLRFGGAGLALYREPRSATRIGPGQKVIFGVTHYIPFDGDWPRGYALYRDFLNQRGHGLPPGYRPPLNWNELFDVGWYHSDRAQLLRHYTRGALLGEAAKAQDIGCDLLYLDPGWELCEGTTLWDGDRLGRLEDFARELKTRFCLGLGYRTIGRVYRQEFPRAWHLRRQGQTGDYQPPRLHTQPEVEPAPLSAPDGRRNLALLPEARASASSLIAGYPDLHRVAHLNDGFYNNPASWVSGGEPSWVEIDFGAEYLINEIAFGSEHSARFNDRAVTKFEVMTQRTPNSQAPSPNPSPAANPQAGKQIDKPGESTPESWMRVFAREGRPVRGTEHFLFEPIPARRVRVAVLAADSGAARIDELEVYEAERQHGGRSPARRAPPEVSGGPPLSFWEVCTQSKDWQREKLKRILAVTGGGAGFIMFDEFDWRGPCFDPAHGHAVPSTPEGHVRAVYGLIEAVRSRYPRLLVEAHDPVWPWGVRYLPIYFRQAGRGNRYQENWGFEFMWNPIEDLRSGRALCLYYYNLACDIPLYDHLTMEGDNDACLAFWWYASTVRHLGIGGKKGLNSKQENETRYAAYKKAVAEYNRLREFFAAGRFVGLSETAHLHVHPRQRAAVINVFNLSDRRARVEVRLGARELGWSAFENTQVTGPEWRKQTGGLALAFDLPPLSPALGLIREPR